MKNKRWFVVFSVPLFVALGTAQAATVTQSANFDFSVGPYYGSERNLVMLPSGTFTAEMSPFNATLGTLNSFDLEWDFTFSGTLTVDASNSGGGSIGAGGTFFGGISYGGDGTGHGDGGVQGDYLLSFDIYNLTNFPVIETNPPMLAVISGNTNFDVLWDSTFYADFDNVDPLVAQRPWAV